MAEMFRNDKIKTINQHSSSLHHQLATGITSGWNCCSVRVWELPQFSPASHADNSPHSSSGFTSEHGVDL